MGRGQRLGDPPPRPPGGPPLGTPSNALVRRNQESAMIPVPMEDDHNIDILYLRWIILLLAHLGIEVHSICKMQHYTIL
jgi:hypothetical protein